MRIVAGTARGRVIESIDGLSTRPTLDRVREAVFGSLQFRIPGAAFLDLFSGSGAMGLEAASRGAGFVLMNDASPACITKIRENAQACGLTGKITLWNLDWEAALSGCSRCGYRFDIVYLDPPYASGFSPLAAARLFENGLMADDGTVLIEHPSADPVPEVPCMGIIARRTRKYGKCAVTEYVKE